MATYVKTTIGMQELKEIVSYLNSKPFNENLTLVSMDQLSTLQLGQLLAKIFKYLYHQQMVNIKEEQPESIIYKFSQILKILDYPSDFDQNWGKALINGDRKVIYPILHFLLTRLKQHQKRCYLAKFMVLIEIPEQFQGDPQIKKLIQQYRQQQAQFQVQHEQYQNIQKNAQNPGELKKQIQTLEQQKDQLNAKINIFKNKNTANKAQFQILLDQTSLLRKQQQEQARLIQKIFGQKNQLDQVEANLMQAEQRLLDAKKSMSPTNTPEQMLQSTKQQVNKNRELAKQRLTRQLQQKRKKLQYLQRILASPPITQNQLMTLETNMMNLKRAIAQMEDKVNKENPKDDKLTIYKQQAAMVLKKKDQMNQQVKRQQLQLEALEKELSKKQQQLKEFNKGGIRKGQDYLNEVKEKKTKFAKLKQQLEEMKSQTAILRRTEAIIKQDRALYNKQFGDVDLKMPEPAKKQISGSVQEITKQIQKILQQIKIMKSKLQPKMDERKELRDQYEKYQIEWKQKKIQYDKVTARIDNQMGTLNDEVKKLREQVYGYDSKVQVYKYKSQIVDLKLQRLNEEVEAQNCNRPKGIQYQSYTQWFKKLIDNNESEISDLTSKRQEIKENHEFSLNQMTMFIDLKKLLKAKSQMFKNQISSNTNTKKASKPAPKKPGKNVDVLQL